MNNLNHTLKQLIKNSELSENELAKRMNITVTTLNKIKTGIMSNPTLQTLHCIAQYFKITIDQLIGKAPLDNLFSNNLHCVPFINFETINKIDITTLNFENYFNWKRIELDADIRNHKIFATSLSSEAMFPLIDKETIVIIDEHELPRNHSLVLAHIAKLDELLMRKLLIDGSFWILKAINTSFPEIHLNNKDKIIGTIIATIKEHGK